MLNECLRILIDCSELSKTYYNVYMLFGSSTWDRHALRIYQRIVFDGRKLPIKPVTWQKTCNNIELFGSVLSREIVMHDDAYIGGRSDVSCISLAEEPNNSIYSATSLALQVIFSVS